jgi:hypothetical protein
MAFASTVGSQSQSVVGKLALSIGFHPWLSAKEIGFLNQGTSRSCSDILIERHENAHIPLPIDANIPTNSPTHHVPQIPSHQRNNPTTLLQQNPLHLQTQHSPNTASTPTTQHPLATADAQPKSQETGACDAADAGYQRAEYGRLAASALTGRCAETGL